MEQLKWYLPTFYGDIRLERTEGNRTRLFYEKLTASERLALGDLRKKALNPGLFSTAWVLESDFPSNFDTSLEGHIDLAAPIKTVQAILAKSLKPDRDLISVVRFADGRMHELPQAEPTPPTAADAAPAPTAKPKKPKRAAVESAHAPELEGAVAATTVAAPVRGCPAPDFERAELRANRVLEAFLTPQQTADFRRWNSFLSVGASTGHTYVITSRHARDRLKLTFWRSLYDLDEKVPYCVHDWVVPAAEEMLALHLFLSMPGREQYLRDIPANGLEAVD